MEQIKTGKNSDNSNNRTNSQTSTENATLLKGSYSQIMVNPTQLSEYGKANGSKEKSTR